MEPIITTILPLKFYFIDVSRILFGSVFFIKLFDSYQARKIVWAHNLPNHFKKVSFILLSSTLLFTVGFMTPIFALVQLVTYTYLYRFASIYGMDDTVCHSLCFYFILTQVGTFFSLDSYFGLTYWSLGINHIPEIILAIIFGSIFISAGIKKSQSPVWQKGLGVYYFFLLPLHRRMNCNFILKYKNPLLIMNYLIVFMQLSFLPILLANLYPIGSFAIFFFSGFAISLCTLFVFTWLGELILIGFIPLIWLTLSFDHGLIQLTIQQLHFIHHPFRIIIVVLLFIVMFCILWSGIMQHCVPPTKDNLYKKIHVLLRTIARYCCGFIPVDLFGERHIIGPVIYRVFYKNDDSQTTECFKIFTKDCLAGPARNFRPTFIEVTQYKVAEACLEIDQYGEIKSSSRKEFILKLAEYIADQSKLFSYNKYLIFKTVQLIPPDQEQENYNWYLNEEWLNAFQIKFIAGKAVAVEPLHRPILRAASGRDIKRISFDFNPEGV